MRGLSGLKAVAIKQEALWSLGSYCAGRAAGNTNCLDIPCFAVIVSDATALVPTGRSAKPTSHEHGSLKYRVFGPHERPGNGSRNYSQTAAAPRPEELISPCIVQRCEDRLVGRAESRLAMGGARDRQHDGEGAQKFYDLLILFSIASIFSMIVSRRSNMLMTAVYAGYAW